MTIAIHEALDRATAGAHRDCVEAVRAAAAGLLMPLGVEGVRDRVTLRVTGDRWNAVHELLVDRRVVWRGARGREHWESTWLVQPQDLVASPAVPK